MEIFKDIKWYEWKYQSSTLWRIKSLWRLVYNQHASYKIQDRILKHKKQNWWYLQINISKNWITNTYTIHRLVAQTFIPNPENKPQVNHINWIKIDNRVENLWWCTASENQQHSWNNWLNKITKNHCCYKNHPTKWKFWKNNINSKTVFQYDKNLKLIKKWYSISDITRELWFFWSNISNCCNWKQKTYKWCIWRL
jgi:hypothetical protein